MRQIQNRKALITGGTSGIGFEIAKILLREGCAVAAVGLQPEKSEKARAAFAEIGGTFKVYTYDLATSQANKDLAREYLKDFGHIDLLVNNCGYATYETFEESSYDEIERLVAVNLTAHVLLTKLLLPSMIERKQGEIVNVSSVAGKIVITPNCIYGASKHAIIGWSQALSYELDRFNISVKVICPGRVDTDFFLHPTFLQRQLRPEMKSAITASQAGEQIVNYIKNSNGFLFFIPKKFSLISWCYHAIPFLKSLVFRRLMISRIKLHYETKNPSVSSQKIGDLS